MARNQRNGAQRNSDDNDDHDPTEDATLTDDGNADRQSGSDPMSLDDSQGVEDAAETVAKDVDGVPYCRVHHCRMIQSSGGKTDNPKTYYKCKVAKCVETARIIKTSDPRVVPDQPLACPRCSKEDKPPVICERDPRSSTAACVILICPRCRWKSTAMAVPQLAAAHFARGRTTSHLPPEEIGAR
jgi:hypothetical protein